MLEQPIVTHHLAPLFWGHHLVKNPMVVEHEPAAVAVRHRPRDEYVTDYVNPARSGNGARSYIDTERLYPSEAQPLTEFP